MTLPPIKKSSSPSEHLKSSPRLRKIIRAIQYGAGPHRATYAGHACSVTVLEDARGIRLESDDPLLDGGQFKRTITNDVHLYGVDFQEARDNG